MVVIVVFEIHVSNADVASYAVDNLGRRVVQDEPPIVLDMATTVAAYGKVKTAAQRGEAMPVGWMIDREGKPLTDPKRASLPSPLTLA